MNKKKNKNKINLTKILYNLVKNLLSQDEK